jgi:hypothetical protein
MITIVETNVVGHSRPPRIPKIHQRLINGNSDSASLPSISFSLVILAAGIFFACFGQSPETFYPDPKNMLITEGVVANISIFGLNSIREQL